MPPPRTTPMSQLTSCKSIRMIYDTSVCYGVLLCQDYLSDQNLQPILGPSLGGTPDPDSY